MIDIHEYLAEFDDIPGTRVYTAKRARAGYHLNQFAMSLMKPENRERWKADERAYLDEWPMTEEQKQAVLARDYNRLLDLGGNIHSHAKFSSTDGLSSVQGDSKITGLRGGAYQAMRAARGRPPGGRRSSRDRPWWPPSPPASPVAISRRWASPRTSTSGASPIGRRSSRASAGPATGRRGTCPTW